MAIVTETNAFTKWCAPLSEQRINFVDRDFVGGGTPTTILNRPRCIGSRCMLWEWVNENNTTASDNGYCGFSSKRTPVAFTTPSAKQTYRGPQQTRTK